MRIFLSYYLAIIQSDIYIQSSSFYIFFFFSYSEVCVRVHSQVGGGRIYYMQCPLAPHDIYSKRFSLLQQFFSLKSCKQRIFLKVCGYINFEKKHLTHIRLQVARPRVSSGLLLVSLLATSFTRLPNNASPHPPAASLVRAPISPILDVVILHAASNVAAQ